MANVLAKDSHGEGAVISTGNSEIDKKMGGGIPLGSLTIIEGQSGAGKSVLSQQMVWGSLNDKFRTLFYTTENTVRSLIKQMESLSLDISDQLLLDWLRIYPIQATRARLTASEVFRILLRSIQRHEPFKLVVIDSLTTFVTHTSVEETISFFEECKNLCNQGKTIIATAHSYAFQESTLIRIRSLCDAHLRLRIEEVGDQLVKVLEVAKVRGADKSTGNIISFDVEPGIGMRIIPVSKAKA
ncbi:MAG TPA: AAA family ATPase [Dehalococcoidia bacterium]|nr:AAA family ATPase [Dehalococcoidia bacterium]